MIGNLDEALITIIQGALPDLFGGETPSVQLDVSSELFEVAPQSADADASAPRPDDRTDTFSFDSENPVGPYTLTQPPYPGRRRVWLVTEGGDRIALRDDEVIWDEIDSRIFSLNLRPTRDLTGITGVQVLYGVTAIFTKIKLLQRLALELQSPDTDNLDRAEALVTAVIALNRQSLMDAAQANYENGDYGAIVEIKSLSLTKGTRPNDNTRLLTLEAETELKATRALRETEGKPIKRIRTPGRPVDPDRPIDIQIDISA